VPGDHAIGRSRGGPTTKIPLAADGHRPAQVLVLTAGPASDAPPSTEAAEAEVKAEVKADAEAG
jgi:hypothetical protein